jgi:hypothetical protein
VACIVFLLRLPLSYMSKIILLNLQSVVLHTSNQLFSSLLPHLRPNTKPNQSEIIPPPSRIMVHATFLNIFPKLMHCATQALQYSMYVEMNYILQHSIHAALLAKQTSSLTKISTLTDSPMKKVCEIMN